MTIHSCAHISKETQRYLASRPQRFQFVFVAKHGSWLNLVENMFSKMARSSVLSKFGARIREKVSTDLRESFGLHRQEKCQRKYFIVPC
jgi:hypothetical protein